MRPKLVDRIRRCVAPQRIKFDYYKGRYALLLLKWLAAHRSAGELRASPLRGLLEKPAVRAFLAGQPDGRLDPLALDCHRPPGTHRFRITLDRYGERPDAFCQVSRPGANLVVQLNFPRGHNRVARQLLGLTPKSPCPFTWKCHPNADEPELTLAWARVDIDASGEMALIEEVQTDWVKLADELRRDVAEHSSKATTFYLRRKLAAQGVKGRDFNTYVVGVLRPFAELWSEAVLAAALWVLVERIGCRQIWYHTHAGGLAMKGLEADWGPPRSLYTDLPKRFCFATTPTPPPMLAKSRNARVRARLQRYGGEWFVLSA